MLSIYARTFMIATLTEPRNAGATPRRSGRRGAGGWLGAAWRRLAWPRA